MRLTPFPTGRSIHGLPGNYGHILKKKATKKGVRMSKFTSEELFQISMLYGSHKLLGLNTVNFTLQEPPMDYQIHHQ